MADIKQAANNWISVKTRLPEPEQIVDLWVTGRPIDIEFYCAPYRHGGKQTKGRVTNVVRDGDRWRPCGGLFPRVSPDLTVTHWMPIPESPE